jgi:hypothetical protein
LGNHNAQRIGVRAHLGDKTLCARSGLLERTPAGFYRRKPGCRRNVASDGGLAMWVASSPLSV